jgi:restriction system protein
MGEKKTPDDATIAAILSTTNQQIRRRPPTPRRSVIVQAEGVSAAVFAGSLHAGVMPEHEQPSVLLQAAILNARDDTSEGQLIEYVKISWLRIVAEIRKDPDFLYRFAKEHRKFEEFIAATYDRSGEWDRVILTPQSGDKGRDVIVERDGIGALRFVEQAKALSEGRLVTHDQVLSVLGVLQADPGASKAIITTTTDFAPGVLNSEEFKRLTPRLETRSGKQLLKWLDLLESDE